MSTAMPMRRSGYGAMSRPSPSAEPVQDDYRFYRMRHLIEAHESGRRPTPSTSNVRNVGRGAAGNLDAGAEALGRFRAAQQDARAEVWRRQHSPLACARGGVR